MSQQGDGTLQPADAFAFLLGTWRVTREVSGMAVMAGVVEVTEVREGMAAYAERMAVRTKEGAAFGGSVRYAVRRTGDGFALEFAETGMLFQEVVFARGEGGLLEGEAVHHCGEDRYQSRYELRPEEEMMVRHVVTGSRKNYVSVARFAREVDGG